MPVKWNSQTDQILLLKILETSSVNVDVKAVSASWPKDQEAPTPRAISERLVKIRAMAKSSGTVAHFSVSGSNTSTPRKTPTRRPAAKKNGNGVTKNAARKRKRVGKHLDSSDTDEISLDGDHDSGADAEEITSPSKRRVLPARGFTSVNSIMINPESKNDDSMAASNDGTLDDEADREVTEI